MPSGSLCTHWRRIPSYSLPQSAAMRPWATFSPLFVASGCCPAPLGDVLAPFRRLKVLPCALGRRSRPCSLPKSAGRHPWATFMPLSVACECWAAPLGDVFAPVRCLRVPPCAFGRRSRPFSLPVSAGRHPWATFMPLFVACECRATPLGDVLPDFGPIALTDKYFCGLMDFA